MTNATETTCTSCDYSWDYSGNMVYATCPSCRTKTKVESEESEEPEVTEADS